MNDGIREPVVKLMPAGVARLRRRLRLALRAVGRTSDADVEVVPVKSQTSGPVEAPVLPPARRAWEYLGESLMRG